MSNPPSSRAHTNDGAGKHLGLCGITSSKSIQLRSLERRRTMRMNADQIRDYVNTSLPTVVRENKIDSWEKC